MKKIVQILFLCLFAIAQTLSAQKSSTADQLYKQGVIYMKTMTIVSQNKAISAFEKARVAYDSSEKKKLCDDQIATCKKIKQQLARPQKPQPKPEERTSDEETIGTDTIQTVGKPKGEIVLNPSEISISAKGGKYIEISVDCDGVDWKVESCPDWLSCTTSNTKLLVKAEKNKDKRNERAGVITIVAGKAKAELLVKQSKANILGL